MHAAFSTTIIGDECEFWRVPYSELVWGLREHHQSEKWGKYSTGGGVVVVVVIVVVLVVILVVIEFLYYIQFGTIDIIILLYTLIYIYYCRLFYRVQMKAV